jgi:predicted NBD/HSP70 family sugar kinase
MDNFNKILDKFASNPYLNTLFYEIRENGPVKKSTVGETLPVSKPTRYSLIKELIEVGIIVEKPLSQNGESRRSSLVDVVDDKFFSIGLDIHMEGIDFVLMDINTNVKSHIHFDNIIDSETNMCKETKSILVDRIQTGLEKIITKSGVQRENIISMGISDAGSIDSREGISVSNPFIPDWTDVPIRNIVNRIIQVPVFLIHDANLMTLAEINELNLKNGRDLICITLRRGIGLGIFINNQIYIGQSGNAGEISQIHIPNFDKQGAKIEKHDIDSILGFKSLMKLSSGLSNSNTSKESVLKPLFKAYEAGDNNIVPELNNYIELLGNRIANLVLILDTGNLILAGRFIDCGERFIHQLSETIKKYLPFYRHQLVKITTGKLGLKAASLGAAHIAQEMLFNPNQQTLA